MAQEKKGFIARMLEGQERSEEYARSTLPTNRWQLFWDIFKGSFDKLIKVNLLTMLFFIPVFAVIILNVLFAESNGMIYPFGANLSIGYPAMPGLQGISEWLIFQGDVLTFLLLFVASFVAAVGLSGGMYVMRNMVWTEGIFVTNDFWRGVKLNYKNAMQTAIFISVVLILTTSLINFSNFMIATGGLTQGQIVWLRISQALSYVFMVIGIMMSMWMVSLGVNYEMGFWVLVKNSFFMTIGTLPQTIFFGALAAIPFLIFLIGGELFTVIGILLLIFLSFAWFLLLWLNFSQWVFDKYINPKIQGAKVGRGIYNKDGTPALTGDDSEAMIEYQRILLTQGRSKLVARPVKPIDDELTVYELPESFTREDLKKLRESKQQIAEDSDAYVAEHENDAKYVEYNRMFDEREKALEESEANKKKKKKPKLLGE